MRIEIRDEELPASVPVQAHSEYGVLTSPVLGIGVSDGGEDGGDGGSDGGGDGGSDGSDGDIKF